MGNTSYVRLAIAALAVVWAAGSAHAGAAFMQTNGPASQPVGHYELCQRMPGECSEETLDEAPIELSRTLWTDLIDVNNAVNVEIVPRTDMEIWGVEERWSYPDTVGDCEDFVLEKRRRLIDAGVPPGDLLITVVRQPNGAGHAVLTVHTSLGDFILDNLEPRVLAWDKTEYRYLKRQSSRNSGRWVAVDDGRATAVASVSAGN